MGTHTIFESDFDCLTEVKSAEMAKAPQKSKEAKAKAASGGGKKSKKKWSKGKSRDKLQNMCLFDKPTYDRVLKEVPNYKVITPSIVSDRMKIRGSLARRAIKSTRWARSSCSSSTHPKWSTPVPSLLMTTSRRRRPSQPKKAKRTKCFQPSEYI